MSDTSSLLLDEYDAETAGSSTIIAMNDKIDVYHIRKTPTLPDRVFLYPDSTTNPPYAVTMYPVLFIEHDSSYLTLPGTSNDPMVLRALGVRNDPVYSAMSPTTVGQITFVVGDEAKTTPPSQVRLLPASGTDIDEMKHLLESNTRLCGCPRYSLIHRVCMIWEMTDTRRELEFLATRDAMRDVPSPSGDNDLQVIGDIGQITDSLYHGIPLALLPSFLLNGPCIDRAGSSNGVALGHGFYLTTSAEVALQYASGRGLEGTPRYCAVVRCSVITGLSSVGRFTIRASSLPTYTAEDDKQVPVTTVVDRLDNPRTFVVFNTKTVLITHVCIMSIARFTGAHCSDVGCDRWHPIESVVPGYKESLANSRHNSLKSAMHSGVRTRNLRTGTDRKSTKKSKRVKK
jgi:hypothetical protein